MSCINKLYKINVKTLSIKFVDVNQFHNMKFVSKEINLSYFSFDKYKYIFLFTNHLIFN